jgi:hypothetical protein
MGAAAVIRGDKTKGGAYVDSDGSIIDQSGVIASVVRNGVGDYTITLSAAVGEGSVVELQPLDTSNSNIGMNLEVVSTTELRVRAVVEA